MNVRTVLAGLLVLTAAAPAGAGDQDRLSMRVSPAVAFAPANLVVRTMIPAHADNRSVEIVAESPEFYRSSQMQLDGDQAPRSTMFEFRSLPSGTYEVKAVLRDIHGEERAAVRQQVNVIQSGGR